MPDNWRFVLFLRFLLNKVKDIGELVDLDEKQLTDIMGNNQNAKLLHDFIHKEHTL